MLQVSLLISSVVNHIIYTGRFSNLLVQQIPPPRNGTGPRWDTGIPLHIIFYCMEQTDFRRQMLGSRLMTLVRGRDHIVTYRLTEM